MASRSYDLILYGATGFVGRQAAAYLARGTGSLTWAIAGRDARRLAALQRELAAAPNPPAVVVAEAGDAAAVEAMAAATRVLISSAGPFARIGDPVVDACVRRRTHYADISGETVWVRGLIDRHHAQAGRDGTRIVPFCGFDSIPSDLGALLVARHLQQTVGAAGGAVVGYYRMSGRFNGGTAATFLDGQARAHHRALARDPFLLDPDRRLRAGEIDAHRDPSAPRFDRDLDAWVAPFIMGPINTRVVRRSAALLAHWGEGYGPRFGYQEYTRFAGPLTGARAAALAGAAGLFGAAAAFAPSRALLARLLPQPGSGPTEAMRARGWFEAEFVGRGDGRSVRARIAFTGDPGNRATLRLLCESGLLLAGDVGALPGGAARGGVLTPATALGEALVPRLRAAGFRIEIGG